MTYTQAKEIAEKYKELLRPYCERIEIAGGIRREKSECHDIELVVLPKSYYLEKFILDKGFGASSQIIKNGTKYKQIILPEGIKLDLFICSPETFPINFFIRTGSANFIKQFIQKIRKQFYTFRNARLVKFNVDCRNEIDYNIIDVKTEQEIFGILKINYIQPVERI